MEVEGVEVPGGCERNPCLISLAIFLCQWVSNWISQYLIAKYLEGKQYLVEAWMPGVETLAKRRGSR